MEQGLVDVTGYRTSCSIQDAVDYFNKGILAFITLKGDSMLFLNKALEVDPDFLLAHCVLVSCLRLLDLMATQKSCIYLNIFL